MFKKKVYIIGSYPPEVGGVATYNLILSKLLITDNFTVEVMDLSLYSFYDFLKILMKVKKNSIFIDSYSISIDNISFKRLPFYLAIIIFKKIKWIRIIHDGTFPERYKNFSKVKKLFLKISSIFVSKIVCVNNELRDFFINKNFDTNKLEVIGSLLPFYDVYNLEDISKEKLIITSGAFTSNYSLKDAVLAYGMLSKTIKNEYKLIILNSAFSVDNDYKMEVINLIKNNKLHVEIYENLDYISTLKLLKKSKIYIRNVKKESFGLAKVEALILGNQVISTNTGIIDYMNIYKNADIEDLFNKLIETINSRDVNIFGQEYYIELSNNNYNQIKGLIND